MRLRLINANTSTGITERMLAHGRRFLPPDCRLEGMTAKFGAPYIASREASAVAAHAVVDLCRGLNAETDAPDAAIIACFGDPGLWAAREILSIPVIGMAEASCHTACQLGRDFAIVTGGPAWVGMLREFVADAGLSSRLAGVIAGDFTGADVAADPDRYADQVLGLVLATVERDKADVVILGGAGFVGIAERIADRAPVPVLDSLHCALSQARALVDARP